MVQEIGPIWDSTQRQMQLYLVRIKVFSTDLSQQIKRERNFLHRIDKILTLVCGNYFYKMLSRTKITKSFYSRKLDKARIWEETQPWATQQILSKTSKTQLRIY